jgi:hypothetical protein
MNLIDSIQDDIKARLESDPFFQNVTVLKVTKGVLASDEAFYLSTLNEKNGKIGACVCVMTPSILGAANPNLAAPVFALKARLTIIESPEINRDAVGTGVTAEQILSRVVQLLNGWMPEGDRGMTHISANSEDGDEGIVTYACDFSVTTSLAALPKVARPVVSAAANSISATCATAGADVYYTVDGSLPFPGNGVKYVAPFNAPALGTTLRFAAYKTGFVGSDAVRADWT